MTFKIPAGVLAQHVIALGKTKSGKSSTLRVLVEGLLDADKPVCIIDPKGDWWGIKSSADGKKAGYPIVIFGGEHADVPINAHAGASVAELIATGNRSCLIDLGGWMVGERTRFFVDLASNLFKHARGMRHLVIDECHNFAPQGKILDPDAGKMLHWANRLASEGQGKGITILAASQRPQKVHKDFLTSCETLIAKKVIHKLDRDAIKDWIDGCADPAMGKEVIASLAQLKKPQAWVWSPEVDYGPILIEFPMFKTYDSFKPQGADARKLQGWADVDLEQVKSKLEKVVAEAQANDPAALKKRIAELERNMAKLPSSVPVDPEALDRASNNGYQAGFANGRDRGWKDCAELARPYLAGLVKRNEGFVSDVEHIVNLVMSTPKFDGAAAPRVPHAIPPKPLLSPVKTPVITRQESHTNGSTATLTKAERLVLTALAQYRSGRSKTQVAILAGYAHTGGGFNNALGSLRSRSFIDGGGDRLTITTAGLEGLGSYDELPHGPALLQHWMRQLSKAERKALETLAEVYPHTLTKQALANRAGYEADGGGFNNALGKLRSLELITGRGEIRASEDLF